MEDNEEMVLVELTVALRLFLCITLHIPAVHDFYIISARECVCVQK